MYILFLQLNIYIYSRFIYYIFLLHIPGVKCNEREEAMLCSLCPNTTNGCQGDCRYDKVHELCYRKGNNCFNHRYFGG